VRTLIDRNLRALRDNNPFKRHTSVADWPKPADPYEKKQHMKQICLDISQDPNVKRIIPESPITHSA